MAHAPTNSPRKSKLLAAMIIGIPLVLMALATFMYTSGWMTPSGRVNHGQLITPVIALDQLMVKQRPELASEKWQLILRVEGICDADCDAWVVTLRQLHVALGKNESRVVRTYLSDHPVPPSVEDIGYYRSFVGALTPLAELMNNAPADKAGILVADPLGNIMMYYSLEASPKDIIEDMKKLLKLSMVG